MTRAQQPSGVFVTLCISPALHTSFARAPRFWCSSNAPAIHRTKGRKQSSSGDQGPSRRSKRPCLLFSLLLGSHSCQPSLVCCPLHPCSRLRGRSGPQSPSPPSDGSVVLGKSGRWRQFSCRYGRRLVMEAIMGGDVVSRRRGRCGYHGRLALGEVEQWRRPWTETSFVITVD